MHDDATVATKADLRDLEEKLTKAMAASEERLMHYFRVVTEELVHDFRGIFQDRVEQLQDARLDHERRLERLERKVGLST